jgi:hypothetical protein
MVQIPIRRTLAVLLAAGVAVVLVPGEAWAPPPPPPSFWNFHVTNSLPMDVTDVAVTFTPHDANNYGTFSIPFTVSIDRLPQGRTVRIGLPTDFGVARIGATGQCPVPKTASVGILAAKGDFDGNPQTGDAQGQEYAGFCPDAPTGQTGYIPRLEFKMVSVGNPPTEMPVAHLHAKWRWDDHWAPDPVEDEKPFQ